MEWPTGKVGYRKLQNIPNGLSGIRTREHPILSRAL